ncbi:MAG: GNAT family N-acetyltransferase [Micavibrio sp.]|nr:GNAT family N-acetyltransferase [Micavibrio sp.]
MRPASATDFDLAYDVYMDETVNPYMWHDPMEKNAFESIFEDMLARDFFWIIQDNNNDDCGIISAINFSGRGAHIAEIQSFGIKKECQGRGLGKSALNAAIETLRHNGINRIQLGVEADNPSAIGFYKQLGFIEEGRQTQFLHRGNGQYVDEILMAKIF